MNKKIVFFHTRVLIFEKVIDSVQSFSYNTNQKSVNVCINRSFIFFRLCKRLHNIGRIMIDVLQSARQSSLR